MGSDLPDEYDCRGGERGKHARAYRQGYTITVRHEDGTESVRKVEPEPGVVVLDPDLRPYFPDSETVNRVLRTLVEVVPRGPEQLLLLLWAARPTCKARRPAS